MANLWPWLVVAGLGALHGLNPAGGWPLAAAWGLRSRDRAQALRALLPIAAGHLASVVLVGATVVWGLSSGSYPHGSDARRHRHARHRGLPGLRRRRPFAST